MKRLALSAMCLLCVLLMRPSIALADDTTITLPDASLYDAVAAQLDEQGISYASAGDGKTLQLEQAELAKVKTLTVRNAAIESLSGIEGFWALTHLEAAGNNLTATGAAPVGRPHQPHLPGLFP